VSSRGNWKLLGRSAAIRSIRDDLERVLPRLAPGRRVPPILLPNQFSKGIIHVLVGGTVVVRDGRMVEGVFAGKPIRATMKTGG
jgi:hypothetical protein